MNPVATLRKHGLRGTAQLYLSELRYRYACFRTSQVEAYRNPSSDDLSLIETELAVAGEVPYPLQADPKGFRAFTDKFPFPPGYHGGMQTGHWYEKIFEHYISYTLLGIDAYGPGDAYLDVAAGGSPWVRMLRELRGIDAFAIDLAVRPHLRGLNYYREEDATRTSFGPASVRGISLHCAYEMFTGDSDMRAIPEFARILAPGGAVIIVPLYLHTHYCCYSSPEYWGKGFADIGAREYVRRDARAIPSSRKYDPAKLRERVLVPAQRAGLEPYVHCLRRQGEISPEIYCHFILELRKPHASHQ
jgi:hypothetical protein